MKYLFFFRRANPLLFFALLLPALLGLSSALAGEAPPSAVKGTSAEEEVPVSEELIPASEETEDLSVPASGFTIGVRGAVSILNDSDFSAPAAGLEGSADYGEGYKLNFMLGYAFGNGLRLEAEAGYTAENCFTKVGTGRAKGKLSAFTFMANAYYDLDLGSGLVPYVGTGLGGASVSGKVESSGGTAKNLFLDESDYVLAYQVGAGLGYKISEFSGFGFGNGLTVTIDYRYLASLQDVNIRDSLNGGELESFGGHYIGGGIRLQL